MSMLLVRMRPTKLEYCKLFLVNTFDEKAALNNILLN